MCGVPTSPYIPVQGRFLYLVAIMDWGSRRMLPWQLSNTMDTKFCLEALTEDRGADVVRQRRDPGSESTRS